MANDTIVVVGGGLAAARVATEYRSAGGEKDVTIVGAEPDPPYNRPPLTKGYLRGEVEREGTLVQPLEEWEEAVVELRLDTRVEAIHPVRARDRARRRRAARVRHARRRDRAPARASCPFPAAISSVSTRTERWSMPTPSGTQQRRRTRRS